MVYATLQLAYSKWPYVYLKINIYYNIIPLELFTIFYYNI